MKKFKEELFELMLKHASKELVDEMVAEYPSPEELKGKYDFSPEFEKRIEEIIKSEENREKKKKLKNTSKKLLNTGKRIAIAICIITATLSVVAFTVPPIRVALLNFCIERNEEYISFDLQEQGEEHIEKTDDDLSNIISYIPEGFETENITENGNTLIVTLVNDDVFIRFTRYTSAASIAVDGEDSNYKTIMIGDNEVYTFSKNNVNTIIFKDENFGYLLSSEISMEELLKIAKSMLE